ncbi:hypothetical protein [Ornithinicoccus halotolerans]|uniref:hypothetical protein n=1 Tax=Ornithinicoccus halotolerans TaxID=1748220 RepID=UPI001298237D|nr:hypothetical protein [Ornithinicoccus halotolerans]
MTFDLLLVPRSPGQPWDEAVAAARAGDGQGLDPVQRAQRTEQFERVIARLRDLLGEVLAGTDDDADDDSPARVDERDGLPSFYGEAHDPDTGLVLCMYETSATLSIPLEEQQEDPQTFAALARQVVAAVAQETGWAVFDPQTGDGFDGRVPVPGAELAPDQDLAAPAVPVPDPREPLAGLTGEWPGRVEAAAAAREAEAQRRRARRYLLVGAVVAPLGLWLVLSGSGFFAWLALAIGLVDLVVGYRAWQASRA